MMPHIEIDSIFAVLWGGILVFAFALILSACVTTTFEEEADGVHTKYSVTSAAAPFGKVDRAVHSMQYKFNGSEIKIGQDAEGMDNTAQVVALKILVDALVKMALPVPTPGVEAEVIDGDI